MPNHLSSENSPYLLQHANNPVEWFPWDSEALEKARLEDKPIFLSIGYAACHWCHVMAHESFEDAETATIMNKHFVNIKVDREERPDLDGIYMQAVVAMTGQGGWPMSVFLTSDGQPFYGGTYFPPVQRGNLPSFRQVLLTIANLWREDRSQLLVSGSQISEHLQEAQKLSQTQTPFDEVILNQAAMQLAHNYDWKNGGWGRAPKFPQPMSIEFLLCKSSRGDTLARDIAAHVLKSMAKGGMYDVVGGGFARYTTDDKWCVPHFEKMLYDNAQLALTYLHGWLVTRDIHFREVCEETLNFIIREMTHPQGGFYSSLDADSEGEEGKYYLWTLDEIQAVLGDQQDTDFITSAYDIKTTGNFEGKNLLQRALDDEQLSTKYAMPVNAISDHLSHLHQLLLTARSKRVPPGTDDKVLVSWNAFALAAFSEAGRYLDRKDYLEVAQRNADFLLSRLMQNGRLFRSWRDGQAKHNAYLEDYAALILGLLALYQSDPNPSWYLASTCLADEMINHFSDPDGGFFDTSDDHETLILRPKNIQDNATPSGNALAVYALLQLAAYEGRSDWRALAEQPLSANQNMISRYPTAFAKWLQAADFMIGPTYEVALIGDINSHQMKSILHILWRDYRPRLITAISDYPPDSGSPRLLFDRPTLDDQTTAYICKGFVCQQPTNQLDEIATILAELP